MTQTPEIAVFGGFGSNDYQVKKMCEQISLSSHHDVQGIAFNEAVRDPERAAFLLHERRIITHSAGAMAAALTMDLVTDVTPESVVAVAPPYPVASWQLIWRARQIARNELEASRHDPEVALANIRQTGALARELIQHAKGNFGKIPAISHFNAFTFGAQLSERGIATTLAFMDEDEFFPSSGEKFRRHFGTADQRIDVVQIPGYHCEFAQNPRRALGNIATAQALRLEEAPDLVSLPVPTLPALAPA